MAVAKEEQRTGCSKDSTNVTGLSGSGFPDQQQEIEHFKKSGRKEASRTVVFQDWQNMERDVLSFSHGLGQHQRVRDIRYHRRYSIYVYTC